MKKHIFPILTLIVISLYSIWPVITNFTTHIPETYDGLFITWNINETIEKIPYDLPHLFEGNIFYPYQNVKAYSETFVTSALLAYIPVKLTGIPIAAFNFPFIFGQIATMLALYFWYFELSKSRWSSVIAAIAVGLSQIRMHYFGHLQMWGMEWWLLSTLMLWQFAKSGKIKHWYFALFFFILQMWESLLPAFWIILIGILLIPSMWKHSKRLQHSILTSAILTFVFISPVLWLYFAFYQEFHTVRSIRDAAHFAMSVDDLWKVFFSPGLFGLVGIILTFVILEHLKRSDRISLQIGTLSLVGFYRSLLNVARFFTPSRMTKELTFLMLLASTSFVLSLGPVLNYSHQTVKLFSILFIPLPYGILYYIVPGFGAFRTSSRFVWLFAFALGGIVALLLPKLPKYKFLTILLAIFFGTRITTIYPIPQPHDYPPLYAWLQSQPNSVILELPIYTSTAPHAENEVKRMLYSLSHKKKLVNGYSGFFPPEWLDLVGDLGTKFPSAELEQQLKDRDVDYIIVHKDEYGNEKVEEIEKWGKKKTVWEDDNTYVIMIKHET